jgi:hypothetical protein
MHRWRRHKRPNGKPMPIWLASRRSTACRTAGFPQKRS